MMSIDVNNSAILIQSDEKSETIAFTIGEFDKTLVKEGGWVGYADNNY